MIIVTRFYKTDPNCTSGKIKLTLLVDNYTILLLVLILSILKLYEVSFLGGVVSSNGGVRPYEGPGLAVISCVLLDGQTSLARRYLYRFWCISADKKPVISCVDSSHGLPPF